MAARRTIARDVVVSGIALHSGAPVTMRLRGAIAGEGIRFCRTDLSDRPVIDATWQNIVDSRLATVIGKDGITVAVTEHLLAAIAGAELDDVLIEIDGPELPLLDGDAASFLTLLDGAGIHEQRCHRETIVVHRPITVHSGGSSAGLRPSARAEFWFEIDFPGTAIGHQTFELRMDAQTFRNEIAPARTFGFLNQAEELRKAGLARGASLENTIVIDGERICNPGLQRFGDEFVRHKILDAIGDLKLAGAPIAGRFEGRRSSHALNAALLRALFADPGNYKRV